MKDSVEDEMSVIAGECHAYMLFWIMTTTPTNTSIANIEAYTDSNEFKTAQGGDDQRPAIHRLMGSKTECRFQSPQSAKASKRSRRETDGTIIFRHLKRVLVRSILRHRALISD